MKPYEAPREVRTLSLMPTYRCTAACAHCGTLSKPQEKTHLDPEHLRAAIDEATNLGFEMVVFTGGEATLAGDTLFELIAYARDRGLQTRLVSNAWWARNADTAAKWLDRLASAGLVEINFSTGDEHARFVPVERVVFATCASIDKGLPTSVMVEVKDGRAVSRHDIDENHLIREVLARNPNASLHILESPWMPLTDESDIEYGEGLTANRTNVAARSGCDSVLNTTTVGSDGTISACCGIGVRLIPELHTGNIVTGSIEDAIKAGHQDFLKHWIAVEGPERILAWASEHDPSIQWEGMYAHRCHACLRMYRDPAVRAVIEEHYQEKVIDVLTTEWLLNSYGRSQQTTTEASRSD
jgi:organic radical activating enzyme